MLHYNITTFISSLPPIGCVMGLDYGRRKIGIARSDMTKIIANPYATYIRRSTRKDLGELNQIFINNQVTGLVVGIALNINGEKTELSEETINFSKKISIKSKINIYFYDESFSTIDAIRLLRKTKMAKKKIYKIDDKVAACIVLQQALDFMNSVDN